MANISEERFIKVKHFIQKFEREFQSRKGRKPSKEDILSDPKVLNYYKFYWKFANNFKNSLNSIENSKIKKGAATSENRSSSTDATKISTNVWGSNLNKSKQHKSGQKLEDFDRFQATSVHIRRVFNDLYQKQKKDSSIFSIRNRKADLLKRSYVVTEEVKAQAILAQNEASKKQNNVEITKDSVQIVDNTGHSFTNNFKETIKEDSVELLNISENVTAESLFESIINPKDQPVFCEFEEEFVSFDHLNTFIKDSVIGQIDCEDGFMKTEITYNEEKPPATSSSTTKPFDPYEFDDSSNDPFGFNPEQGQKRSRIYIDDDDDYLSITKTDRNVLTKKRTKVDDNSEGKDGFDFDDTKEDNSSGEGRRFFKNEGRNIKQNVARDFYEFTDEEDSGLPGNSENISNNIIPVKMTLNSSHADVSDDSGTKSTLETSPKNNLSKKKKSTLKTSEGSKTKNENETVKKKKTVSSKIHKENFQRLNMKKGKYARGNKNFNMRKYKYQTWASNKRKFKGDSNTCFKCGETGHWASQCSNADIPSTDQGASIDSTEVNEHPEMDMELNNFNFYSDKNVIPKKLFDDIYDPELEDLVQEGLKTFGFEDFRLNQKITVKRILCGKSTLLISPTGSGKSLCYQLAAWCFWKKKQLITLVISPLISLMQDQMINFPPGLVPVSLNSSMNDREKEDAASSLIMGKAQVLFLSPESIVGSGGLNTLGPETLSRVGFVCIDEAHCLAEWSINFRPSYLHLFKILNNRYGIGNYLALTATATKDTQKMVCKNLKLSIDEDVVGKTWVPENLILSVSKTSNKLNSLIDLLQSKPFKELKSIIIYCTKRAQTEQLVQQIRTLLQFNLSTKELDSLAKPYHAGLGSYERQQVQKQFLSGKLRIVVATIAFGMGINKKNIRGIIHYNLPKTFENYLQEIGRAGRDGKPAYCHLLLDMDGEDLFSLQSFIYANGIERPSLRKLVGKIFEACKCANMRKVLLDYDNDLQNKNDENCDKKNDFHCPTHPVALPIDSLQMDTDIKSDTIYTLLMALELSSDASTYHSDEDLSSFKIPQIQVFPPTNSMAHVVNYGEHSDMNQMLQQSSLLKMAVFIAKREMGNMFDLNNYSFSLMKLAKETGKTVAQIRQELRKLNWKRDEITGKMKRSTLNIRYDTYSYYLKAPGDLNDEQNEKIVDYLSNAILEHEKKEIFKLRLVYSIFNEYSIDMLINSGADSSIDSKIIEDFQTELLSKSNKLKDYLNNYFQDLEFDYDSTKLSLPLAFKMKYQPVPDITLQIAKLINVHYDQGVNTPRRMARILQGISSPKFPADIWFKVRDFWKSLPMIDFSDLMQLCSQQLSARYSFKLQNN